MCDGGASTCRAARAALVTQLDVLAISICMIV